MHACRKPPHRYNRDADKGRNVIERLFVIGSARAMGSQPLPANSRRFEHDFLQAVTTNNDDNEIEMAVLLH